MIKKILSHGDVADLVYYCAQTIITLMQGSGTIKIWPVPRGGVPVAYMLGNHITNMQIVESPHDADIILDDIVDSGITKKRYNDEYPNATFYALIDKQLECEFKDHWVVFPWEMDDETASVGDNVIRLLQYIGEDPTRQGLLDTPKRVVKAWEFKTSGYGKKASSILKCFEDGAESCDQMVVRRSIPFYSQCEHHLEPIIGHCTIAYIPEGKIVGLSKMDRLCDMFARRLQVQERLTNQIADAMFENLKPLGVGVWISARHLCVESRGVCNTNSETITQALRGNFLTDPTVRAEFMGLCK